MSKERDVIICPRCKTEMLGIDQKSKDGQILWEIAKCFTCSWAIALDHWMISQLVKKEGAI